jgi:integrase
MPRQPNGQSKIYLGADGAWHTYVTVGRKADGTLDRRHIRGKTATAVADKVEALKAKLRIGHIPEVGKAPTIGAWLEEYLTVIAPRRVRANTLQGYASTLRHNVIPAVGHIRLDRPLAEIVRELELFFSGFERRVAPEHAVRTYRILSRALKIAAQRGKLPRNPCELFDAPSGGSPEVEPLSVDEIRRILAAAHEADTLARWWVGLALGLRQGEALGLLWDHVDIDSDTPSLRVQWELIRLKVRHGCKEPCGKRAGSCPQRQAGDSRTYPAGPNPGGLVFSPPKSKKGRRTLPLPKVLVDVLKEHRRRLKEARLAIGPGWQRIVGPDRENGGLVFPRVDGGPKDPRKDWGQWKDILVAADVRQVERVGQRGRQAGKTYVTSTVRVHDARHAAGTTMFANGMERRELMEWLGHSQISVSARYTHVSPELMRARAEQLNGALELLQPGRATKPRKRSS